MFLGLGIDHDAGVTLTDQTGKVVWSAAEERFSRKKNHYGFPFLSLAQCLSDNNLQHRTKDISAVIFGTYGKLTLGRARNIIDCIEPRPFPLSNFGRSTDLEAPGKSPADQFIEKHFHQHSTQAELRAQVERYLATFLKARFGIDAPIHFSVHHDAHAASAFFASTFQRALVVTFDGQGDGESGVIALADRNHGPGLFVEETRIPSHDSLGHVYSAVTNRYGLKTNRHEGKILGLAALGDRSSAVDRIRQLITVSEGVPKVTVPLSPEFEAARTSSELRNFRHTDLLQLYIDQLEVPSFPDLAFAVQTAIEEAVMSVVEYWLEKFNVDCIALAGGLFANVKVNQRLAEGLFPAKVYIYPNMGDGGLPVGGVWSWMHSQGMRIAADPHPSMLIGPGPRVSKGEEHARTFDGTIRHEVDNAKLPELIAKLIAKGLYCGVVNGRSEFGPRALCNRTILADPRSKVVNQDLNNRLRRTEYMPFAPVCLADRFAELFDIERHASLKPFAYMTMLCSVRTAWRERIPAVVHVDGTARPQYLTEAESPFAYSVLKSFELLTGVPCLVNTSFNVHEEPIVLGLEDAIRALRANACDCVASESAIYYLAGDERLSKELRS